MDSVIYDVEMFATQRCVVYFGDFLLGVHSFEHITTADLKSDVIF